MTRIIAYYLLWVYGLAAGKPVLPLLRDALAHRFWAEAHHAGVHRAHGAAHVHHELAQQQEDTAGAEDAPAGKSGKQISEHHLLPPSDAPEPLPATPAFGVYGVPLLPGPAPGTHGPPPRLPSPSFLCSPLQKTAAGCPSLVRLV